MPAALPAATLVAAFLVASPSPPATGGLLLSADRRVVRVGGAAGHGYVSPPDAPWPHGPAAGALQTTFIDSSLSLMCHEVRGVFDLVTEESWTNGGCTGLVWRRSTDFGAGGELLAVDANGIMYRSEPTPNSEVGAVNLSATLPTYVPGTLVAWHDGSVGVALRNNTLAVFDVGPVVAMGRIRSPRLWPFPHEVRRGALSLRNTACFVHDLSVACYPRP
jgi:hypothetical protein